MTNKFSLLIKKYSVPALFMLFALGMLYVVMTSPQNKTFVTATVMMFVAGVLTLLYSSGAISSKILTVLGILALAGAIGTLFYSTKSVVDTNKHMRNFTLISEKAALNLGDVRTAQKAYMEQHGHYTDNWDSLIYFIENGKVPYVNKVGTPPNRKITPEERGFLYGDNRPIDFNMTEEEALRLSLRPNPPTDLVNFKRDTVMVSFLETKFKNKSYTATRMKKGFGKFSVDSLMYVPGTKTRWQVKTLDSLKIGEEVYPAVKVWGMLPLAEVEGKDPKEIGFGSLTMNDLAGTWEQ